MSAELVTLMQIMTTERRWYRYFTQGTYWKPDGRDPVAIADMPREWRFNCVRFLERRATAYAGHFAMGCHAELWWALDTLNGEMARDCIENELDGLAQQARRDPLAWIRTTELYLALASGLPIKGAGLRHLQERSGHWDGCRRRERRHGECTCAQLREADTERRRVRRLEQQQAALVDIT